jgi:HAD superfamily hydrolase (TIGR01549 family)
MPDIHTIFLDLGGTLRTLVKDQEHMAKARSKILELLEANADPLEFCAMLDQRYKGYRIWAFETLKEAPEAELWTRWLVPDFPAEKVAPLGTELTYYYRQSMGRRVVIEHGKEVLDELRRRGYTLGIISNLIGTREIQEWLDQEGFTPYFKSVALSSVLGIRKPDPTIYIEAARQAGVSPENCAYIGDNHKRDVTGTRLSGFGLVVLLLPEEELIQDPIPPEHFPDVLIHDIRQILDYFPERPAESHVR